MTERYFLIGVITTAFAGATLFEAFNDLGATTPGGRSDRRGLAPRRLFCRAATRKRSPVAALAKQLGIARRAGKLAEGGALVHARGSV